MRRRQAWLIGARAVQGLGGAVVAAVALSLIMNLFTEPGERAKAMGVYGFVCAGGGSIGVLLGGLLTGAFSWHWIFLVNLPIGIAVYGLTLCCSTRATAWPTPAARRGRRGHDHASLMLAVYAIVGGNEAGCDVAAHAGPARRCGGAAGGVHRHRVASVGHPLMPLTLFRLRNVATANVVGVLWAAAMFAWFFISALYMQLVLATRRCRWGWRSCRPT